MGYSHLNKKQAAFFLANYPALCENLESQRENIIEGYRQSAVAGGRGGSLHSDPTARKAILLLELSDLITILRLVRQWIDCELIPNRRPLLLSVWRLGKYGWQHVAKERCMGVVQCQEWWQQLTESLLTYLKNRLHSAGDAKE